MQWGGGQTAALPSESSAATPVLLALGVPLCRCVGAAKVTSVESNSDFIPSVESNIVIRWICLTHKRCREGVRRAAVHPFF